MLTKMSPKTKRSTARAVILICLAALTAVLMAPSVFAQLRSSTISGTVVDEHEAVVPNVEVKLTDEGTSIVSTARTTNSGKFTFPYLPAGTFTLEVASTGFTTYRQTGIRVAATESIKVDALLKVQSVQSSIDVLATSEQVQANSATVQTSVAEKLIDIIPNTNDNPLYYAMLQANVQPTVNSLDTSSINAFGIGINGRRQFSAVGINGGLAFQNDIQVDGLPVTGGGYNEASVIPNTEGLAEVRVISNNFTAEYGHGQGAISMNTKSGTNQFHGSGNYKLRNEALNANGFANNQQSIARTAFKVNEFGGALAGPILRNRMFFASSYHYLRHNRGVTNLLQVPTAKERVGDFSDTLVADLNGKPAQVPIYDPYNIIPYPSGYERLPYPNSIIPTPNAYALKMFSYYPTPNKAPLDFRGAQNYQATVVQSVRRHNSTNRVDYQRGRLSLYGSGGISYANILTPRSFGKSPLNGAPDKTSDKNPYAQIGATVVVNPTLVVDIRAGYNRIHTETLGGDKSGFTDYDSFGVPKNVQTLMAVPGAAPYIAPGTYTALTGGLFATKVERQQSHVMSGSATKISGKWTFKFGAENRTLLSNYMDLEEAAVGLPVVGFDVGGPFTFRYLTPDGLATADDKDYTTNGYAGARLFTGAGYWFVRPGGNVLPAFAQKYFAAYSQNDWRITQRLTINLGLRWDLQPGPTERYDRMSSFDLARKNAWGALGTIVFPGTEGYSRNLWNTEYRDIQPRLGVAYQAKGGFVLRGGFGITYLPSNTGYFSGPTDYGSTTFSAGVNTLPYGTSPNGIPSHFTDAPPLTIPSGANSAAPALYGNSGNARLFARNPDFRNGMAYQANFFIERRISRNWAASVGYSGSIGRNLMLNNRTFQSLQLVDKSVLQSWHDEYIATNGVNPATKLIANPYQPTSGPLIPFSGQFGQSQIQQQIKYMPYPLLFGAAMNLTNGYSDYHSLIVTANHSFTNHFLLDANFTWSKALDYALTDIANGQGFYSNSGGTVLPDFFDPHNRRKYAAGDTPARFNLLGAFESPALSHNKLVREITGKWTLGPVLTWQSGFPLSVSGASDGSINGFPDRIPGVPIDVPASLQRWYDGSTPVTLPCGNNATPRVFTPAKNTFLRYNPCAFAGHVVMVQNGTYRVDQYWYGTSANNFGDMRSNPLFNLNLTLRRSFRYRERINLDLSAEAANVLNHTQLRGTAGLGLGSTTTANSAASGLYLGMGNNSGFGSYGNATYDPRQVTVNLQVRF